MGGDWTGELPIEDAEDIKNNAASDIHVKRFQAKKWKYEQYKAHTCEDGCIQQGKDIILVLCQTFNRMLWETGAQECGWKPFVSG